MLAKSIAQVLNQLQHVFLGTFGEILLDIELADAFAHHALDGAQGLLPAGTLLLNARHHLVELEACVGKVIAQVRSGTADILPQVVVFLLAVAQCLYQVIGLLNGVDLGNDHRLRRVDVHCLLEPAVPWNIGVQLLKLGHSADIVHGRDVAALLACPCGVGQQGLDLDDVLGDALGILGAVAGQLHVGLDQLVVSVQDVLVLLVLQQVIVAVAQTETGGADVHGVDVAVAEILLRSGVEEGRAVVAVNPDQQILHILGLGVLDLGQVGLDGSCALAVAAHGVHGQLIDVGDLVGVGALCGVGGCQTHHQTLHAVVARVVQDVELSVAAVLGAEGVVLHPLGVHVAVEILLRRDVGVEAFAVETFQMLLCHAGDGSGCKCKCQ